MGPALPNSSTFGRHVLRSTGPALSRREREREKSQFEHRPLITSLALFCTQRTAPARACKQTALGRHAGAHLQRSGVPLFEQHTRRRQRHRLHAGQRGAHRPPAARTRRLHTAYTWYSGHGVRGMVAWGSPAAPARPPAWHAAPHSPASAPAAPPAPGTWRQGARTRALQLTRAHRHARIVVGGCSSCVGRPQLQCSTSSAMCLQGRKGPRVQHAPRAHPHRCLGQPRRGRGPRVPACWQEAAGRAGAIA